MIKDENIDKKKAVKPMKAGLVQAVCCGVWDIGEQEGYYGLKRKVVIAFETMHIIDNPESEYHGKRMIKSNTYTTSLYEKANLRKDLESWFGTVISNDKIKAGIDLEKLVGKNAMLNIVHTTKDDNVYANIASISPLMEGMTPMIPENDNTPPEWVIEKQKNGGVLTDTTPVVDKEEQIVADQLFADTKSGGDIPF